MPTKTVRYTIENFIETAKKVHIDRYNYSRVVYIDSQTEVEIICPIHGSFWQTPNHHLKGCNCQKCSKLNISLKTRHTKEDFIIKARKIHGDKYDYSLVNYENSHKKVIIVCRKHGKFLQIATDHTSSKAGCPKCFFEKNALEKSFTTKQFINKARKIHGNKYDYSKVNYCNAMKEVIIICPKHGDFLQIASCHINQKHGCPYCKTSKGERKISNILDKNNIKYIRQKSFIDCINPKVIKTNGRLKYDFYLPEQNLLIEFNGQQHYMNNGYWNTDEDTLKSLQYRDQLKKDYALSHGYRFLVIKYTENIEEALKKVLQYSSGPVIS